MFVGLFITSQVMAANSCTVSQHSDYVSPLNIGNITAGPELPLGTILYKMKVSQEPEARIICQDGLFGNQYLTMDNAPEPLSSWTGSPYSGAVYETGVPGIGVTIWSTIGGGESVTLSNPVFVWRVSQASIELPVSIPIMIAFIKTGNIQPGAINGANLPSLSIEQRSDDPTTIGLPAKPITLRFTGQINISSASCATPDVNVDLGAWDTNVFKGIGSATEWRDASIIMEQCPQFYGYIGNGNMIEGSTNGSVSLPTMTSNTLSYKLTPVTPIINSAEGIFEIEKINGNEATGVGIQIASGTPGSNSMFDLNSTQNMTTPNTSNNEMKIPLVARYIQQESNVTPGTANGKVTFLINYY